MPTAKATPEEIEHYTKVCLDRGGSVGPMSRVQCEEMQRDPQYKAAVNAASKPRRQKKPILPAAPRFYLRITLPGVLVVSELNIGKGLRAKIARKTAVKEAVRLALPIKSAKWWFGTPIRVTFTRLGTKKLDDDNLTGAFKAVRDVMAEWLGVDDGDTSRVRWVYKQRASFVAGIRIEIR